MDECSLLLARGNVSPGSEGGAREPGGGGQIFRVTSCRCLTVLVEHECILGTPEP